MPIPVTVMKRPITNHVSKPENVVAILMKEEMEFLEELFKLEKLSDEETAKAA